MMVINKRGVLILLAILVINVFPSSAQALWLSGYEYRKEITIDHTKIGSELSNFPLAVILSDTTNIIDGNDVKFTLSDGETLLNYEKEKYVVNDAAYWVNIPTVSSGVDTKFYMYYGKTGDTNESTTAVWDSNYKMVQHLEETSGTHYDSTSNNNSGTPYGGVNQNAAGQIDGADSFDGSNDYVDFGSNFNIYTTLTVEAWINQSSVVSGQHGLVEKTITYSNGYTGWALIEGNGTYYGWWVTTSSGGVVQCGTTAIPGEWVHLVGTVGDNYSRLYLNGVEVASQPFTSSIRANSQTVKIGKYAYWTANNYFNGLIDEVRISDTARSEDWIVASYYSESNNLLTFGNQEGGAIPEPTSLLLLGFGVVGIAVFKRRKM